MSDTNVADDPDTATQALRVDWITDKDEDFGEMVDNDVRSWVDWLDDSFARGPALGKWLLTSGVAVLLVFFDWLYAWPVPDWLLLTAAAIIVGLTTCSVCILAIAVWIDNLDTIDAWKKAWEIKKTHAK